MRINENAHLANLVKSQARPRFDPGGRDAALYVRQDA
jgi:hypothetical protein